MAKKKFLLRMEKSKLMDIFIKFNKESFKFNLFEELKIDEGTINSEIMEQPTYYAFLAVLAVKLNKRALDLEKELNKIYADYYVTYKGEIDPNTSRPYNNDMAEALATTEPEYQEVLEKYNTAVYNKNLIETCSKAFEQRASLLQSLSANVRREKSIV